MNYIFSFKTNDNNTFNLIYTHDYKHFIEEDKNYYLKTPYFVNLIETIEVRNLILKYQMPNIFCLILI